jgi:hypothetical protein
MTITISSNTLEKINKLEVTIDFYTKLYDILKKYGFSDKYTATIKQGFSRIEINNFQDFITLLRDIDQTEEKIKEIELKLHSDEMYFSICFGSHDNMMYMSSTNVVNSDKLIKEVNALVDNSTSIKMKIVNLSNKLFYKYSWILFPIILCTFLLGTLLNIVPMLLAQFLLLIFILIYNSCIGKNQFKKLNK